MGGPRYGVGRRLAGGSSWVRVLAAAPAYQERAGTRLAVFKAPPGANLGRGFFYPTLFRFASRRTDAAAGRFGISRSTRRICAHRVIATSCSD